MVIDFGIVVQRLGGWMEGLVGVEDSSGGDRPPPLLQL